MTFVRDRSEGRPDLRPSLGFELSADGIRDVGVASLMTDPAVDLVHELVIEVHTHAPNVSRKRRRRMPGALLLPGATLR